jgi:hypothetical protein
VPPVPRWDDETAVTDYVRRLIDQSRGSKYNNSRNRLFGRLLFNSLTRRVDLPRIIEIESERAIAAAKQGNYLPLARLLESKHPLNDAHYRMELRRALPVKAYDLIGSILSGQLKRPTHRPKLTDEERRASTPVHNAADDFRVAKAVLPRLYPEQSPGQIHDRAVSVAAKMHKVGIETLRGYLKRSKSDRRRPDRP